jgi:hypothetical protein
MRSLTFENIDISIEDPQIWKDVLQQVRKDFDENQIKCDFDKSLTIFDQVFDSLKAFLLDMNFSQQDLLQLLYRIDVPEKNVQQLETIVNLDNFLDELTRLILRRELQKVMIRKYYSNEP